MSQNLELVSKPKTYAQVSLNLKQLFLFQCFNATQSRRRNKKKQLKRVARKNEERQFETATVCQQCQSGPFGLLQPDLQLGRNRLNCQFWRNAERLSSSTLSLSLYILYYHYTISLQLLNPQHIIFVTGLNGFNFCH